MLAGTKSKDSCKAVQCRRAEIAALLAIIACISVGASQQSSSDSDKGDPNVNTIVQESSRVADADQKASSNYDFFETDLQSDGSHKTYIVGMLSGSPYQELVAVNGKALPPDKEKEEQQKLQRETARRKSESQQERVDRIAKYQKEMDRNNRFLNEFPHAFNFTSLPDEQLDGHQVYVIQASPRPGYRPPDKQSAVLTGMQGKLWIDKKSHQWVKVEAEVMHPVSIDGFLAKVEKGTRFELEKAPVQGNVWLPKHFEMTSKAKILSLISYQGKHDESYSHYHKNGQPDSLGDFDELLHEAQ
jgi:hypothetical protein